MVICGFWLCQIWLFILAFLKISMISSVACSGELFSLFSGGVATVAGGKGCWVSLWVIMMFVLGGAASSLCSLCMEMPAVLCVLIGSCI